MQEKSAYDPIPMEELPKYELFLSQVIELLDQYFPDEHFTGNIIQNYIKSEVITKPIHGKKRGYTRMHLIQLIFLSYMRAILTTGEIKKVFSLAFNEINRPEDDIIGWEKAYEIFLMIYRDSKAAGHSSGNWEDRRINEILEELDVEEADFSRIREFIRVLVLITRASNIKREVREIVVQASRELES